MQRYTEHQWKTSAEDSHIHLLTPVLWDNSAKIPTYDALINKKNLILAASL